MGSDGPDRSLRGPFRLPESRAPHGLRVPGCAPFKGSRPAVRRPARLTPLRRRRSGRSLVGRTTMTARPPRHLTHRSGVGPRAGFPQGPLVGAGADRPQYPAGQRFAAGRSYFLAASHDRAAVPLPRPLVGVLQEQVERRVRVFDVGHRPGRRVEALPASGETFGYFSMAMLMSRRLTRTASGSRAEQPRWARSA